MFAWIFNDYFRKKPGQPHQIFLESAMLREERIHFFLLVSLVS